jgi:hypothetical protein
MIKYKIDNRTLQLLNAQVNLTETFNHVLRTAPRRECLAFRLKAERGTVVSTFVVGLRTPHADPAERQEDAPQAGRLH